MILLNHWLVESWSSCGGSSAFHLPWSGYLFQPFVTTGLYSGFSPGYAFPPADRFQARAVVCIVHPLLDELIPVSRVACFSTKSWYFLMDKYPYMIQMRRHVICPTAPCMILMRRPVLLLSFTTVYLQVSFSPCLR